MRKGNVNNNSKRSKELNIDTNINNISEILDNPDTVFVSETISKNENDKKDKSKNKDNNKLKVIILILFIILSISITVGLLIYKYVNTNNNNNQEVTGGIENNNTQEVSKKETEDKKYLVTFKEMYTINPLTITDKYYEKKATKKQGNLDISYVEIAGLQDKDLQEKINNEIKTNAFLNSEKTGAKQTYHSYTRVQGNFSNILSISTYIYIYDNEESIFEENIYLNYNLVTGEQINFLDLFASNTPMNAIIYDLEYERLAWDTDLNFDMSEKEWENASNMDYRDTSLYEDKILKVINRYKSLEKDKIQFYVTPNSIYVDLPVGEGGENVSYSIDLYKYIDYVTLYKKFLSDKVVFENISQNKLLVFNDMIGYIPKYYKIEADNLFISLFSDMDQEYMKEEEQALIEKYSKEAVNMKNKLVQQHTNIILDEVRKLAKINKNKGYLARFMPYSYIDDYYNEYGEETLIYICIDGAIEEMKIDYYKENAFKLLAAQNARPKVSIDQVLIGTLVYDNDNVKSLLYNEDEENVVDLIGYYTLDGTLVAKSYEEVEEYLDKKYTKPELEVEIVPQEPADEKVEIYKEEE